ncbi:MAG: hypothetical protein WDZ51_13505 [Pirellulaceae bacterium]
MSAAVRNLPLETLRQYFGEHGSHLWELAHGIDERSVVPDREAKSVSHETTFAQDIDDIEILRAWSMELAEQVARRLGHGSKTCSMLPPPSDYLNNHSPEIANALVLRSF